MYNKITKIGIRIIIIALLLSLIENAYFGWNVTPITTAEHWSDWILYGLMVIGAVIYFYGINLKTKENETAN